MHANVCSSDLGQRGFKMILDAVTTRLALPSGKRAAIVSDEQLEPFDG